MAFAIKSSYGYFDAAQLALVQVATSTEVFVVDALSPDIAKEMWQRLGELLNRSTFTKLCFGYPDEVARLGSFLSLSPNTIAEIVGLCPVWNLLGSEAKFKEVKERLQWESVSGLQQMVNVLLGKPLDKSMHMSDWTARPLRDAQLQCAALDACALVEVYKKWKGLLVGQEITMDKLLEMCKKK